MQSYKSGSGITLTFSLVSDSGVALTPASLSWRLLDEVGAELEAWSADFAPTTPTTAQVVIPSSLTSIVGTRAVRIVELEATGPDGSVEVLTKTFLIQGRGVSTLVFGVNTFQTYGQAYLLSSEFIDSQVTNWTTATRESQEQALMQAFQNILQLPIKTGAAQGWDKSYLQNDGVIASSFGSLKHMTPAQMMNLPLLLSTALKKAQLVEAVDVLTVDPMAEIREAGVLSVKVGESSQFFRAVKPIEFPVCKAALACLQPWLRITAKVGRR